MGFPSSSELCVPSLGDEQAAVAAVLAMGALMGQLWRSGPGHGGGSVGAQWDTRVSWPRAAFWSSKAAQDRQPGKKQGEKGEGEKGGKAEPPAEPLLPPRNTNKENVPSCVAVPCFCVLKHLP